MTTNEAIKLLSTLPPESIAIALAAESAKRSFKKFIKQAWHVHHPQIKLHWNWHMDAICDHLEAVSSGKIKNLIINIPPGFMKSLAVSVYWPAWEWIQRPYLQYLVTAATNDVVFRDARRCHEIVDSEWYQKFFMPNWSWTDTQDAKGYFTNSTGGARMSRSTGQKITGLRADRIIVDDPLDATDSFGDKKALIDHIKWFDAALSTRKNSPHTPMVVIMQRMHERDLSGHLLGHGGWEHLCIPNEYDGRKSLTKIGYSDPRTEIGELLFPYLADSEETERIKKKLGINIYASQYQQLPAPSEGSIFKESTFRFYLPKQLPQQFDYMIGVWDCTFGSTKTGADYVVGQTWAAKGTHRYLLSPQMRARMSVPEMIEAIKKQKKLWPNLHAVVIESKARGSSVINALNREIPGIVGWNPQNQSKESRAYAVTPLFESGQIWFPNPDYFGWVKEVFIPEVLRFPKARHDDQVDAMTMALIWMAESNRPWFANLGK